MGFNLSQEGLSTLQLTGIGYLQANRFAAPENRPDAASS